MHYLVENESVPVQWQAWQPPYRLQVGEELLTVVHHRPGFCLLEDGRCLRYSGVYQAGAQEWTFTWQGRTFQVKAVKSRGTGPAAGAGGAVKSPMNGVVVKLAAAAGEVVEQGQVILVLEAMKMENEVTAPVSGKLTRVEVSAGQVVGANQLLFEIEP